MALYLLHFLTRGLCMVQVGIAVCKKMGVCGLTITSYLHMHIIPRQKNRWVW